MIGRPRKTRTSSTIHLSRRRSRSRLHNCLLRRIPLIPMEEIVQRPLPSSSRGAFSRRFPPPRRGSQAPSRAQSRGGSSRTPRSRAPAETCPQLRILISKLLCRSYIPSAYRNRCPKHTVRFSRHQQMTRGLPANMVLPHGPLHTSNPGRLSTSKGGASSETSSVTREHTTGQRCSSGKSG